MSAETENKFCFTCGGEYDERFIDKPCPECGRQWGKKPQSQKTEEEKYEAVKVAESRDIPKEYIGVEWSRELLEKDKKKIVNDLNFRRYCNQLEKIHDLFSNGFVPNKSAIIMAPPGYSKVTWAYSCMQQALESKHSVTWLLDTIEVKRLLVLASENPRYRLYNKINYDDYIMSDVCFITVTKTEYNADSFKVIQEILDRRSRKGLATFVISRFDLADMSRHDYKHHFKAIMDLQGNQNPLKYPAIISYFETLI